MRNALIVIMCCVAMSNCVPVQNNVNTSHQNYIQTWNSRLEHYRDEFVRLSDKIRTADNEGYGVETTGIADPWESLAAKVFALTDKVREAYTVAGRGETIKAFIEHMNGNQQPGLTDVWFRQQIDDLNNEELKVYQSGQDFFVQFDARIKQGPEWVLDVDALYRMVGVVTGKRNEIESLYEQAISYYGDKRLALHEDRLQAERQAQLSRDLFRISMDFNQIDYQKQLLATLNRPRTCTFISNTMT